MDKVIQTVQDHGNTSAASVPMAGGLWWWVYVGIGFDALLIRRFFVAGVVGEVLQTFTGLPVNVCRPSGRAPTNPRYSFWSCGISLTVGATV